MDHKIIPVDHRTVLVYRDLEGERHVVRLRTWIDPGAMCEIAIELKESESPTERIAAFDEAGARQFLQAVERPFLAQPLRMMTGEDIITMMERTFYGTAGHP